MERPLQGLPRATRGAKRLVAGPLARVQGQIDDANNRDALCCTKKYTAQGRSISGRLGAKCYDAFAIVTWELVALGNVVEDMQLSRFVGLIDLGVAAVVLVTIGLPAREMYAAPPTRAPTPSSRARARRGTHDGAPRRGTAVDDLSRRLGAAEFKDWAIETALHGSERAKQSPTRWRALLATSVAYVDRLESSPRSTTPTARCRRARMSRPPALTGSRSA